MLGGNKNVLKRPQTDKGAGWGDSKPITELLPVEEKDIEGCIDKFKMPKKEKTAVTRLLRHLKKARLQNLQYEQARIEKLKRREMANVKLEVTSGIESPPALGHRVITGSRSEENIGKKVR